MSSKTTGKEASSIRIAVSEWMRHVSVMGSAGGFSAPKAKR